jgi:hypothetical protein
MTISATLISKNFSLPHFFLNDDRSQSKAISVYIMLNLVLDVEYDPIRLSSILPHKE